MAALNHPLVFSFDEMEVSAATRKLFAVQVSGAFIMTDTALSWILYGVVTVQMCNYFSLVRTPKGRGRESLWQVLLLGFVWVLLTATAVTTLDRSIKINSYNFGDVTWTDNFHNRPHNLQVFVLGAVTIWAIQILISARGIAFAKSITPAGHLGWFRQVSKWVGLGTCLAWMVSGAMAQYHLYQYETYSEMIEAVLLHRTPKFLIFQILWLSLGLFGALIMTATMARDVVEARRFNSTNHPSVKLTNAVLISLLRAMLGNWIYICLAHAIYIFAVLYRRSAIAGRGTACLPLTWAFSLLRMIAAPRDTRSRQLMESEEEDLPRVLERSRSHALAGKRLFGFGKLNSKRPVSAVSTTADSRPELGFFSMLRGAGGLSGPATRRGSLAVEEGRRSFGGSSGARRRRRSSVKATLSGIQRSTEVLTYSRREKEFQLLEGPKVDVQDEDEEKWVRRNHLLGIGNAVWVETPGSRRPLSANEHYSSPQLSPGPASSSSLLPSATSASPRSPRPPIQRHATSSPSQRSSAARTSRFGTVSAPAAHHSAAAGPSFGADDHAMHSGQRRAEISFIDSFPTGPVVSQSYGNYDPDLDVFELSPLGVNSPQQTVR